jgi:hypothetical protein
MEVCDGVHAPADLPPENDSYIIQKTGRTTEIHGVSQAYVMTNRAT